MKASSIATKEIKITSVTSLDDIEIGQWYWVKNNDEDEEENEWLGCVMDIGSNYLEIQSPHSQHHGYWKIRIHFDKFFSELRFEPNHKEVIDSNIVHFQNLAQRLLNEVKVITAKLGISPQISLADQSSNEKHALAVLSNQNSIKDYESALILAKDKQLPELFKEIKAANENMAMWMTASCLPLEAFIDGMEDIKGKVTDRVFNVSLYAGLTEQVILCHDGEPASFTEKLHVMQRRLYMDEECLLDYRNGGMDFQSIDEFDEWISTPINRDRILPFPRCLVAMRIRRNEKDLEWDGSLLSAYINIRLGALDKLTFLYIRNGEKVYRLNCDLEFDEMIFPDRSIFNPGEPMMLKISCGRIDEMITKNDFDERVKAYNTNKAAYMKWKKDNPKKEWYAKNKDKSSWEFANPYTDYEYDSINHYHWHPFDPSSIYYDDAAQKISDEIKKYNRIALIIQGLFDRSPVLHPHAPVKTWTPEGFNAAVKLVYDGDSSVLYGGEKPDFELYRKKCNEIINAESVLIGQELYWMKREADKENERQSRDWRCKSPSHYKTFQPYGDPGPGYIANMVSWKKRVRKAVFKWDRERRTYNYYKQDEPVHCSVTVPISELFNVSAYRPGDFKKFFQDPRTREEYLKWAPMLLAAEEYHAGIRRK